MARTADSGIVRLAWTMSGLAASVLVAGSLWLTHLNGDLKANTALASPRPRGLGVAYARDTDRVSMSRQRPTQQSEYLASNSNLLSELP